MISCLMKLSPLIRRLPPFPFTKFERNHNRKNNSKNSKEYVGKNEAVAKVTNPNEELSFGQLFQRVSDVVKCEMRIILVKRPCSE